MKFPRLLATIAGFTLVALLSVATPAAMAQTVISNEKLVTTTFVGHAHAFHILQDNR